METVSTTHIIAKSNEYKKCFKCGRIHLLGRKRCRWCEHENIIEIEISDFHMLNDMRKNYGTYTIEV